MLIHITSFKGLDEGLCHTVWFRTSGSGKTAYESYILIKGNRFSGSVATVIVAGPFDCLREKFSPRSAA